MPFNVQYGPISTAVMLGARAGMGQYHQQQFADDMSFMGQLNDMQRTADASRATDMQNALGYYDAQSRNQLANAQLQQAGAFHGAELGIQAQHLKLSRDQMANMNQYRQGSLSNRQDNTAIRQQALGDKEDASAAKNDALSQLDPQTAAMLQATGGRMAAPPALDRNAEFIARKADLAAAQQQYTDLLRQGKELSTEEMNPITKAKTGRIIPRPGQEQSYNQWLASVQGTQRAIQQKTADLNAFLQPQMQRPAQTAAPVNPQQQQQTAAAASGGMAGGGNQQPGQAPVVNEQTAAQFLQLAHGDRQLARELAQRAGYLIPQ